MEKLPPGYRNEWNTWKTLNRLIVGVTRTKKIFINRYTVQKLQTATAETNKQNKINEYALQTQCHTQLMA